jgi:putative transposase
LWIERSEGAKFTRPQRYPVAVVDGLKGFPEAMTSVFPQTVVQTGILHYAAFRIMPTTTAKPAWGR